MQKFLVSILWVCSFAAVAQESSVSLPVAQIIRPKRVFRDFNFFVNAIPVPLLSGGAGGAIEFKRFAPLTVWFGFEREVNSTNSLAVLSEETKTTSDNRFVGVRYYQKRDGSGFFAATGYKWTEIESEHRPGLFDGVAAREVENAYGMYGGLGWRFQKIDPRMSWIIEMAASYEPGAVKRVTYVPTKDDGIFGPDEARVDTDVVYGVFPEVRFGVNF